MNWVYDVTRDLRQETPCDVIAREIRGSFLVGLSFAAGVGGCRVSFVDLGGELLRPPRTTARTHSKPVT